MELEADKAVLEREERLKPISERKDIPNARSQC